MSRRNESGAPKPKPASENSPAFAAAVQRVARELVDARLAAPALQAGDQIPAFRLLSIDGDLFSSTTLLQRGPMVLVFWSGLCVTCRELGISALEAVLPELSRRGASLLAISLRSASRRKRRKGYERLRFPVLVDQGGNLGAAFGLLLNAPAVLGDVLAKFDVTFQGTCDHGLDLLVLPASYVVGQDGVIAYSEISEGFAGPPDPLELLPALDLLNRLTGR